MSRRNMSKLIAMFVTLVLMAAPTVVLANEHEEHGDKKAHTEDGTHEEGHDEHDEHEEHKEGAH